MTSWTSWTQLGISSLWRNTANPMQRRRHSCVISTRTTLTLLIYKLLINLQSKVCKKALKTPRHCRHIRRATLANVHKHIIILLLHVSTYSHVFLPIFWVFTYAKSGTNWLRNSQLCYSSETRYQKVSCIETINNHRRGFSLKCYLCDEFSLDLSVGGVKILRILRGLRGEHVETCNNKIVMCWWAFAIVTRRMCLK